MHFTPTKLNFLTSHMVMMMTTHTSLVIYDLVTIRTILVRDNKWLLCTLHSSFEHELFSYLQAYPIARLFLVRT